MEEGNIIDSAESGLKIMELRCIAPLFATYRKRLLRCSHQNEKLPSSFWTIALISIGYGPFKRNKTHTLGLRSSWKAHAQTKWIRRKLHITLPDWKHWLTNSILATCAEYLASKYAVPQLAGWHSTVICALKNKNLRESVVKWCFKVQWIM